MPFYEYECQACHRVTEVLQKMSDPPLSKCPSCGKDKLTKLMSAAAFRLTGGGWYETDFKSDSESKRNLAGAEKEEPKKEVAAEAKSEPKTEAKPQAAPEPASPAAPAVVSKKAEPAKSRVSRSSASPKKPAARAKAAAKAKAKPQARKR
jgi:putative FmdB family regulatory protein